MSENKETERNLEEIPADAAEPETMAEEIPEQSEKNLKGNYKTLQQLSVEYGITRQGMKVRLDKMLTEPKILKDLVDGYMEIEQETDVSIAQDKIIQMIVDVKTAFENLDKIIEDIDFEDMCENPDLFGFIQQIIYEL